MSDQPTYTNVGYLPRSGRPIAIHPDECIIGTDARCRRTDHPTATSDCTTQRSIGRRQ